MTHNRETARADARTPEGLWICRICRGLWTAVDEYAHTRPQPPWETSPVTHRVTPDVSHSSLGIPVRNHRDSHSYTAPTTVGWSTLLSQAGRTTETNEAGHLNTRKSPRVASLRTLSTFARNHCPPSSEYAVPRVQADHAVRGHHSGGGASSATESRPGPQHFVPRLAGSPAFGTRRRTHPSSASTANSTGAAPRPTTR